MVVIRLQIGSKENEEEPKLKLEKHKCCICFDKFEIEDFCYAHKNLVDDFHICRKCAWTESIRKQLYDMINFYYINRNKKPGIIYRLKAFFNKDSFDYAVVKAWMLAKEKIKKENIKSYTESLRNAFVRNSKT